MGHPGQALVGLGSGHHHRFESEGSVLVTDLGSDGHPFESGCCSVTTRVDRRQTFGVEGNLNTRQILGDDLWLAGRSRSNTRSA